MSRRPLRPARKSVQGQYDKRPTVGSSGGSQAGGDDSVRYVVTNPAPEREMVASDQVFVLLHDKATFDLLRTDSNPDEVDALSMFGSELTAADSTSRWAPPHELNASMNRIDQASRGRWCLSLTAAGAHPPPPRPAPPPDAHRSR